MSNTDPVADTEEGATLLQDSVNTTVLMAGSAVVMACLGLGLMLFPENIVAYFGREADRFVVVLLNLSGTVYLGFAMLNWMAREHLIGGIYSRPVAVGNFLHFFAGSIGLIEFLVATTHPVPVGIFTAAYIILAAGFAYILFGTGGGCS